MTSQLNQRNHIQAVHGFVSPWKELNAGLWSLFTGATVFLGLRIWCKTTRRHGLWYDDYILLVSWLVLLANNALIVWQFGNGYILKDSSEKWDERMRILINVSSCGTLIGQAWTKTAFGVTLLRITNQWQRWVIWIGIVSMNLFMFFKIIFQWAQICDKAGYQNSWRLDLCVNWNFREDFKEAGNIYNIIMDFAFATFPWLVTRKLEMRRAEKIGLSVAMSLGMVVAIVSAVRVSWKDKGNEHDEYYIYRNGVSQVWYSSEITGTIMVQCIPLLRPLLRDFTTALTSNNLDSTDNRQSSTWVSRFSSNRGSIGRPKETVGAKGGEMIALREIPEEGNEKNWKRPQSSMTDKSNVDLEFLPSSPLSPSSPSERSWPNEIPGMRPSVSHDDRRGSELEQDARSRSFVSDIESQKGLSPPPRRFPV